MANRPYAKALQKFLSGNINLLTDDIRMILVDGADYTPSTSADEFLSAIPAAGRVAVTASFTSKTVDSPAPGVFDAADITFGSASGDQSELLVIYKHTGTDATSPLIHLMDTVSGGGALSVIPNGGDISVVFDSGASRIFAL